MNCRQHDALLEKMILGEAVPKEMAELAAHEAACPACAAVRAALEPSAELLSQLDQTPPMDADFHASWVQRMEEEHMEAAPRESSPRRRKPLGRWIAIAATLVFVLVGAFQSRQMDMQSGRSLNKSTYTGAPASYAYEDGVGSYSDSDTDSWTMKSAPGAALDSSAAPAAVGATYNDMDGASLTARSASSAPQEQKVIRTVSLSLSTRDYDASMSTIRGQAEAVGGWIEDLREYNGGTQSKNSYMTLRIPADKLDTFLEAAAGNDRITSREETAEDITARYQDNQGRLNTQRALMERLRSLVAGAASLSEVLELERSIADIQYAIDQLETTLRHDDSRVNYATVNISLTMEKIPDQMEVQEYTFLQRMEGALAKGLEGFLAFLKEAVLFLIAALPYLAVALVVWGAGALGVKIYRKRHPKTAAADRPKTQHSDQQ